MARRGRAILHIASMLEQQGLPPDAIERPAHIPPYVCADLRYPDDTWADAAEEVLSHEHISVFAGEVERVSPQHVRVHLKYVD